MIGKRTLLIVLLVAFLINMIQAGVLDDVGDALHVDDVKKFSKDAATKTADAVSDAAEKTGDAATSAYHSVKNFFTPNSDSNVESMMKKS